MASNWSDPKTQMLLQMGASILSQPYTRLPQGPFAGIGQGVNAGMNAYNSAMLLQQNRQDRQDKKDKELEAFGQQTQMRTKFQSSLKGLPVAQQEQLMAGFNIDPGAAWKGAMALQNPKPADLDTSSYVDDAAFKLFGKASSEISDPTQREQVGQYAEQLRILDAPVPPKPYADPWVAGAAKRGVGFMDTVDKDAQGAIEKMSTLQTMQALNETIESGSVGAPAYAQLQGLAKDFMGIDISIEDPVAAKEAYTALTVELMRQERKHGPRDARFTDKDAEFYMQSVSTLSNTPAGRKLIVEIVMGREQAKLDRQALMVSKEQEYLAQGMSEGEAMRKATADTKAYDRSRAQNKQGLFVNEETGQLTPLGVEMQKATGQVPGGGAAGGGQIAPPMGAKGKVNMNGQTFPVRMGPNGPEYQGPNGWTPLPPEYH